jgi:diaminopimelate decarboxylase
MLRINLPIEAYTHRSLRTTGHASKFGVDADSVEIRALAGGSDRGCLYRFVGLHAHLGSQISAPDVYVSAAQKLAELISVVRDGRDELDLSLGGGWAVPYRRGDSALTAAQVASAVAPVLDRVEGVRLAVEPGRALVARSAVALYRVGAVKNRGGRRIVSVDGGMGDNPRPALYGSRYTVINLKCPLARPVLPRADIVGRYCESGDILAVKASLPAVEPGDLLEVPVAGAYQLAMASAYNLVPQPAVVMIDGGRIRLAVRRATVDDLLHRDLS